MSLPNFKLLRPRTVEQAVTYLTRYGQLGELEILAGGTDLVPSMKQRLFTPKFVMDVRGIEELSKIKVLPGHAVEIGGPKGFRRVPLKDFYTNDGVVRMKLEKNEMLTRVFLLETMAGWQGAYLKLRIRGSIDYPLAGVAVAIKKNGVVQDAQAAITGVNPAPHLIPNVADALRGKPMKEDAEHNATVVGELAAKVAKPLTTSALTPDYRREMIRVFAKRAVLAAIKSN